MEKLEKPQSYASDREIFISFCENKSLSKTSEQLNIYPSTVSRSILNLEKRLGIKLVKKISNKISLTEAGNSYYLNISPLVKEIITHEKNLNETNSSEVTIISSEFFLNSWVTRCIKDFMKDNKDTKIRVITDGMLVQNNIRDNTIFIGIGRNNKDAEPMLIKNISTTNVSFFTTFENKNVSPNKKYSILDLKNIPLIKADASKFNYLTSDKGKNKYSFENVLMIVDSLYMSLTEGMNFNCVFVACESLTSHLVESGKIYKINTEEKLDPIYIDIIYTKELRNNSVLNILNKTLYSEGMKIFNPDN